MFLNSRGGGRGQTTTRVSLFQLFPPILLRRRSRNDDGGGDLKVEEENGERENGEGMRGFSSSSWNQGGPLPATAQTRPPGASSLSPSPRPPSLSSLSLLSAKVIPPNTLLSPLPAPKRCIRQVAPFSLPFGPWAGGRSQGPIMLRSPFLHSLPRRKRNYDRPTLLPLPSQISEAERGQQ